MNKLREFEMFFHLNQNLESPNGLITNRLVNKLNHMDYIYVKAPRERGVPTLAPLL